MMTLNCIYVTLYFYKNIFNVSTVRIKIARSTIGYSEDGVRQGDTGQILTQWRRPVASRVTLELPYWAM